MEVRMNFRDNRGRFRKRSMEMEGENTEMGAGQKAGAALDAAAANAAEKFNQIKPTALAIILDKRTIIAAGVLLLIVSALCGMWAENARIHEVYWWSRMTGNF